MIIKSNKEKNITTKKFSTGIHFYWSQKKPEIANKIYEDNCKDGDVILDPFLGGGSSLYGIKNTKFIQNIYH